MKRRISHGQATRSTFMFWRVIHFIGAPNLSTAARDQSRVRTLPSENGLSVLFLLRRVNPMSLGIHGKAMNRVLNGKVFHLSVVVWIILMENGNGAAVTRDINPTKTGIKLDHIGSIGNSQKGDCSVLV